MIEDGPDLTMQRWRAHAADVTLFARPEGSPLLEAQVAGTCLQLFERTNPYAAPPGPARVLIDATGRVVGPGDADAPALEVPRRGALAGNGRVVERDGDAAIVDVGAPLLLHLPEDAGEVPVGTWLRFEADPPLHAFVLPTAPTAHPLTGREVDEAV
ncbi:MAG: hypothetical protein WD336_12105 [Trueperaceae bacterium]